VDGMRKVQGAYVCLGSNVTVEAKGVSDEARVLSFLREIKDAHPGKFEFMIQSAEWIHDHPDIERLLSSASEQGLIDAFPRRDLGQNEREEWYYWDITLRPKLIKVLKAEPREKPGPKTHATQTSLNGKAYDTRNERVFVALHATTEALNETLPLLIIQFEGETELRVRRAISAKLWTILTLRHDDINPDLRSKIGQLYAEAWHPEQAAQECVSEDPEAS